MNYTTNTTQCNTSYALISKGVGGIFASGDNDHYPWGQTIQQDLVISLNDGTQVTITGSHFVGFVSDVPFTSLTLDAVDDPNPNWPQVDFFHSDSPEPASLALVAVAGVVALRRR